MGWLPSFGRGLPAAVLQFSVRTLLRSPQHRVILAFYLGMGFAAVIFFINMPLARQAHPEQASAALSTAPIVLCLAGGDGVAAGLQLPDDDLLGGRHPHRLRAAARSARELGLPHHAAARRRRLPRCPPPRDDRRRRAADLDG